MWTSPHGLKVVSCAVQMLLMLRRFQCNVLVLALGNNNPIFTCKRGMSGTRHQKRLDKRRGGRGKGPRARAEGLGRGRGRWQLGESAARASGREGAMGGCVQAAGAARLDGRIRYTRERDGACVVSRPSAQSPKPNFSAQYTYTVARATSGLRPAAGQAKALSSYSKKQSYPCSSSHSASSAPVPERFPDRKASLDLERITAPWTIPPKSSRWRHP